jgi:hypothetical protein
MSHVDDKQVELEFLSKTYELPMVLRSKEIRCSPHNIVVRVGVYPKHSETLRLRPEPVFKLTCITVWQLGGLNRSFTLRLPKSYGQSNKVGCSRGRNSDGQISLCLPTQKIDVTSA